ncbi:MAG: hypothetical protein IPL65_10710 [Lewinellaceae bacterium]|nr:hypothetical protein [Lewinellaceae bacterium]
MKHLFTLILFFLLGSAFAQSPAVTALVETQQGISVGMTEASFFNVKPSVPVPDGTMGFRSAATETFNSNGLERLRIISTMTENIFCTK